MKTVTTISYFGEEIKQCKDFTCAKRCGFIMSKCSCHRSCIVQNTCCPDFGKLCYNGNDSDTVNRTNPLDFYMPPMQDLYQYTTCSSVQLYIEDKMHEKEFMFTNKCPANTKTALSELCEAKDVGYDLARSVPVSTNFSLFSNVYCAECHGIKSDDVSVWQPRFQCTKGNESDLTSMKAYIEHVMKNCLMMFIPHPATVPFDAIACPSSQIVSSCPNASKEGKGISSSLHYACARYNSPVILESQKMQTYKNQHCAICNGVRTLSLKCDTFPIAKNAYGMSIPKPNFALLLDFTSSSGVSIKTPWVDILALTICPYDKVLIDNVCIKPNASLTCLPQLHSYNTTTSYYNLYVNITLVDVNHFHKFILGVNRLITETLSDTNKASNVIDTRTCEVIGGTSLRCITTVKLSSSRPLQYRSIDSLIVSVLAYVEKYADKFVHINEFYLINHDIDSEVSCQYGSSKTYTEGEIDFIREEETDLLFVKYTQNIYEFKTVALAINFLGDVDKRRSVTVCETEAQNCSKVYLNSDQYEILNNKDLMVQHSGAITTRFEMCHDTAVLCSDWLRYKQPPTDESSDLGGMMTLVGNIISLACLALTLLVHLCVPSLRTVPGRCVMALSLSLFVAQLLFQLSTIASQNLYACVSLASLQHYAWLASFSWMSVLAFDLSSTFSGGGKIIDLRKKEKHFCYYNIYAWSVPLVVVAICLVLHLLGLIKIYSVKNICWINGGLIIFMAFALPIAIFLISNFVMFTRCVIGIYLAKRVAAKARKSKKIDLLIYIKLSSLMGFTWISGFLANAVQMPSFWFIFIVCNSLQGVLICVCFALTPRVFRMISVKCGIRTQANNQPITAVTSISMTDKGTDKSHGAE